MHTKLGVRRVLQRSRVSMTDWGRELGVTHSEMVKLRDGLQKIQSGPLMLRTLRLCDALEQGRVKWEQRPARARKGRPYHVLVGPESFKPSTMILYADFETGTMQKRAWSEPNAVSA